MPRLNEKKACPIAPKNTSAVTLLKSGFNKKLIPFSAPGKETEQQAKMTTSTNKAGIRILAERSIPSFTPFATT